METTAPLRLLPAQAWRTYLGGKRIAALHKACAPADGHYPEEWLFSIVEARDPVRGDGEPEGLSLLAGSGIPLRRYLEADPQAFLGKKQVAAWGVTTGVLLKLIDAAERLTIQVHPDRETAQRLFHSPFGKTECWHFLDGRTADGSAPCFYLGFKPGITQEHWQHLFDRQDIPGMLHCLHRFEAKAGQTVLIEGGVPHAIGSGCFLMEIQEPTDYTIRTERVTPAGLPISDEMCHQGLGFSKMMECFSYQGYSADETMRRWFVPEQTTLHGQNACTILIGPERTVCFSLQRWKLIHPISFCAEGRFSGIYIMKGNGWLECGDLRERISQGDSFFIPAECRDFSLYCEEPLVLFRCFGPSLPAGLE